MSEEPIPEGVDLEEIDANCADGDYCGKTEWIKTNETLIGKEAAEAVEDTGSMPQFFQMDRDGNELNDEEDGDI